MTKNRPFLERLKLTGTSRFGRLSLILLSSASSSVQTGAIQPRVILLLSPRSPRCETGWLRWAPRWPECVVAFRGKADE